MLVSLMHLFLHEKIDLSSPNFSCNFTQKWTRTRRGPKVNLFEDFRVRMCVWARARSTVPITSLYFLYHILVSITVSLLILLSFVKYFHYVYNLSINKHVSNKISDICNWHICGIKNLNSIITSSLRATVPRVII